MRGSLKLGSVSGISILVHWTFLLLIGYVAWQSRRGGGAGIAFNVGLVLVLFACVVLHELGHALTAKRFGIGTRDITLLPIGGVARLERIPTDPRQEFLIAIAGPAVNVVIASILFLAMWLLGVRPTMLGGGASMDTVSKSNFLGTLAGINVSLVVFNLLPAFPMDGGRVLRAALAYKLDYTTATRVAARIGQVMAALFLVAGLFLPSFVLMLIALFVFFGAQAELRSVALRSGIANIPVRDAMTTQFTALHEQDTLGEAADLLQAGSQKDFPVLDGERIAGILTQGDVLKALADKGRDARVADVMRRDCAPVDEMVPLSRVVERMQQVACPLVPVTRLGRLVGMLTLENVGEFLMVRSALRGGQPAIRPQ